VQLPWPGVEAAVAFDLIALVYQSQIPVAVGLTRQYPVSAPRWPAPAHAGRMSDPVEADLVIDNSAFPELAAIRVTSAPGLATNLRRDLVGWRVGTIQHDSDRLS